MQRNGRINLHDIVKTEKSEQSVAQNEEANAQAAAGEKPELSKPVAEPVKTEAAKDIKDGDTVSVNFDTGVITNDTTGKTYQAEPFPEFIQNIIAKGGLINSILNK